MVNKIYLMIAICLVLPMINAETFGTYKENQPVYLFFQCQNSSYLNISSIYSNKDIIITSETKTTKFGNVYNYTINTQLNSSIYYVNYHCDLNSIDTPVSSYFNVTPNGKESPDGILIIFFIIAYVVLFGLTSYLGLYSLGHLINLDFDIIDLALDFGLFFAILVLYYFQSYYLDNPLINSYNLIFLSITGFLLVFIPSIAFILNITVGSWQRQKVKNDAPRRMRFRR